MDPVERDRGVNWRKCRSCCSCCSCFIIIASLIVFLMWLLTRTDEPKCSIEYFYVPALNKTLNSRSNTTLNFMVRLDNPNGHGFHYDDVHLSFSNTNTNTTNNSSAPLFVANYTVPKFYQGHKKKARKWGQAHFLNNQTVFRAVLPNGSAVFRVDLKTKVKFRIRYYTKSFGLEVGADVEVNGDGVKAQQAGIKMKKSDSSPPLTSYFPIYVLMNLLVFFAIR